MKYHILHDFRTSTPFEEKSSDYFKDFRQLKLLKNYDVNFISSPGRVMNIHIFYKKFRSGLTAESFLAFCDFEYSKFLNSFLTFFLKQSKRQKENTVWWLKTNNDTFKFDFLLTIRIFTMERFFTEYVFIKVRYCIIKIVIRKSRKNW